MSDTPKNADIEIEYFTLAKELGSYEEANKHFQHDPLGYWADIDGDTRQSFLTNINYRRKPQNHIVNGHEVPEPYREAPKVGEKYCCIDITADDSIENHTWYDDDYDSRCLKRNNCFKSYNDANENYLAMLKLGKYAEVKS